MKTEIPIRAPQAGTVTEIGATVGIQVAAGAILAVIEAESAGDKE
jgi:biotin carboxyl carrier protein